jgi:hypothetical protein
VQEAAGVSRVRLQKWCRQKGRRRAPQSCPLRTCRRCTGVPDGTSSQQGSASNIVQMQTRFTHTIACARNIRSHSVCGERARACVLI